MGFKPRLTDLLIKPIQRLTKYHLLLRDLVKYSQRAGLTEEADALSKAFHVMTIVPNQADDMMDIGRLQGFEGKITAQGKLLHRGPLNALDNFSSPAAANGPPKMKAFTCFLFEQIMIFSESMGKKTPFTNPVYVYKAHFLVRIFYALIARGKFTIGPRAVSFISRRAVVFTILRAADFVA